MIRRSERSMTNTARTGNTQTSSKPRNNVTNSKVVADSVMEVGLTGLREADSPVWEVTGNSRISSNPCSVRGEAVDGQLLQRGKSRMVLAVTLHNLPEGMVVGLAAALALSGEPDAVSGALALSLGIGLQNIPEGAAVSLPLAHSGRTRLQAFGAGAASGLVEPLGALAAFALAGWVQAALPWLMSAAAGCMVCVTAQEMIPEAVEQDEPAGVVSIVLGFALMMALDVAL